MTVPPSVAPKMITLRFMLILLLPKLIVVSTRAPL